MYVSDDNGADWNVSCLTKSCQSIFRGACMLLLCYCKITDTMGKVLLISSESDFMRDVYLTSNKARL